MALANGTIWQMQTTATASNTNGIGFNPNNANFFTDINTTNGTAAAPVLTTASYNFVAGDVGAWVYIRSGSDWYPGWYKITSVASNAATVDATIGHAVTISGGVWQPNIHQGVGTTGVLGGAGPGTGIVDYSQLDSGVYNPTDLVNASSSTTITSAAAGFRKSMAGNIIHINSGTNFTAGFYEIVSVTNTTTAIIDRTANAAANASAGHASVGGAGVTPLIDAMVSVFPPASIIWILSGTYTIAAAVTGGTGNATSQNPVNYFGYTSVRSDSCNSANRPVIAAGANGLAMANFNGFHNLIITSTAATAFTLIASSLIRNCKITNSSTTASRICLTGGNNTFILECEFVSQNGTGISSTGTTNRLIGNYIHDCVTGVSYITTGTASVLINNIFECCTTDALNLTFSNPITACINNTFYGREAQMGNGINLNDTAAVSTRIAGNIFYGLTVGITVLTNEEDTNYLFKNNFFNNGTDCTNIQKDPLGTDLALNPNFTSVSQITGTTATTSGSVLTQSGGAFSAVVDSIDYLHVTSGTGVTVGCYLITAHTATTLTVNNALGTGSSVNYFIGQGHNFQVGQNMANVGIPTFTNNTNGYTTGYMTRGAVQKQQGGSHTFS